ncbi:YraN family protein [Longispora albida]|uniref:YraN family protein n=1 Tax=Longispora albida TaxID=203523 RepID=UPI00037A0AE5|nr:YraN family protein [Longispora albida]
MGARNGVGRYGERVAARYLAEAGMRIVARNWRRRYGELDIIAADGDVLVICEVKTRRGAGYGHPAEAITLRKQDQLRSLASRWLDGRPEPGAVRFDVLSVWPQRRGPAKVEYLRGAF